MSHLNVEIKARCPDPAAVRKALTQRQADFRGVDHQIDTYLRCPNGRLKLREGDIETALIHYQRPNESGPKDSIVTMHRTTAETARSLKGVLATALDVLVVVDKTREIYFVGNVKVHIDTVPGLGDFVEIEAIDEDGSLGRASLLAQCTEYLKLFGVEEHDLVSESYSDLLLRRGRSD
jgi:predicted adenylyl cyclase CyaB